VTTAVIPYAQQERMAASLVKSGLFGIKSVDQAMSLMMIAESEGLHPATVARDYDIIQNRAAKKPQAMMRDFLTAGGRTEWHALDDTIADATFSHPQGGKFRCVWDMDRAKRAGLAGKDNWKSYPRAMLRSRCVSEGIRTVFPGATSGVYTPEEVRDMVDETPADGPKDVTPQRIDAAVLPQLPPEAVVEHLAALRSAFDLDHLKRAYSTAYAEAKRAGDVDALEAFEQAKDHRKLDLTAEDVP
jgi:hypothetical protein